MGIGAVMWRLTGFVGCEMACFTSSEVDISKERLPLRLFDRTSVFIFKVDHPAWIVCDPSVFGLQS